MADKRNREDDSDNRVSSKPGGSDSTGNLNDAAGKMNAGVRREASSEIEPAEPATSFSQASQVGRARTGGAPDSALEPGESTREGWDVPDQSDTPPEWPEPTID